MVKSAAARDDFHYELYLNLKKRAREIEDQSENSELRQYASSLKEYLDRPFSVSNTAELRKSIAASDFIFLGDFHTFDQSTKNLERILDSLFSNLNDTPLALGVEFVDIQHQGAIDAFLEGLVTELEFLEMIFYSESWRFPWPHYQLLFRIARQNKMRVFALNSREGGPYLRDQKAARVLADLHYQFEGTKFFVLFGELHLFSDRLPGVLRDNLGEQTAITVIHQNLDEIYWRARELSSPPPEVLQFREGEFCLLNALPWVKYEGQIHWFENILEDPEYDIHEALREGVTRIHFDNIDEEFALVKEHIIASLQLHKIFPSSTVLQSDDGPNIYDSENLRFVLKVLENKKDNNKDNKEDKDKNKNKVEQKFYQKLSRQGKNFKIIGENVALCLNPSLTKLSKLAGPYIYENLQQRAVPLREVLFHPKNWESSFAAFFYLHTFTYLSSKMLNPFQKCDLYCDLKFKGPKNAYLFISALANSKERARKILSDVFFAGEVAQATELMKTNETNETNVLELSNLAKICGDLVAEIFYQDFLLAPPTEIQSRSPFSYQKPLKGISGPRRAEFLNALVSEYFDLDGVERIFLLAGSWERLKNSKKRFL